MKLFCFNEKLQQKKKTSTTINQTKTVRCTSDSKDDFYKFIYLFLFQCIILNQNEVLVSFYLGKGQPAYIQVNLSWIKSEHNIVFLLWFSKVR